MDCSRAALLAVVAAYLVVSFAGDPDPDTSDTRLRKALDKVDELNDQVGRYIKEVNQLRVEKVKLTKTVNRIKDKYRKLKATTGGGGDGEDSKAERDMADKIQQEAEKAEEYFRRETGQLVLELGKVNTERRSLDQKLRECRRNVETCQQQQTTPPPQPPAQQCEAAADNDGGLLDQLSNCQETVKVVRERCTGDQRQLEQTTEDYEQLKKDCFNCTAKLADCESMKGYLEFLKRGYEAVVPDLEKEKKEADEERQKFDADAQNAIKDARSNRLYMAVLIIVVMVVSSVKLYEFLADALRRKHEQATAAKAQDKLSRKKRK